MGDAVDRDRILEGVRALKQDPEGSEMIWSGDVEAIIRYAPAVRGKGTGERGDLIRHQLRWRHMPTGLPAPSHWNLSTGQIPGRSTPQRGRLLEPRVLGLEEYRAIAEKPRNDREPVWEDWRNAGGCWKVPQRGYEGYGTAWRCWTDRPTGEQRKKAKWRDG